MLEAGRDMPDAAVLKPVLQNCNLFPNYFRIAGIAYFKNVIYLFI